MPLRAASIDDDHGTENACSTGVPTFRVVPPVDDVATDDWWLSSLQARILEGVAAGSSSVRLSRELYVSPKTVDYHVRAMSDRLAAPNRVALVSRAYVRGILEADSWPPSVASDFVW